MANNYRNIGVNISSEVLATLLTATSSSNVRCSIYQVSTGYYWSENGSNFSSGKKYTSMTNTAGHIWRTTFTPNVATTYLIEIELEGDVVETFYFIASGGVTSASSATGWNLSQLRTLLALAAKDNTLTDDNTADADNLINLAIQDISGEFNGQLRCLEDDSSISATDGTGLYSLDSDVNDIITMYLTSPSEDKLDRWERRRFIRYYPDHTDEGTPTIYVPWGIDASGNEQVYLYPVPNTSMTVYYDFYKKIGNLSSDSDIPEIPQIFQPVIIYRAAYLHSIMHKNDAGLAALMLNMYEKGISNMHDWNLDKLDMDDYIKRHGEYEQGNYWWAQDGDFSSGP